MHGVLSFEFLLWIAIAVFFVSVLYCAGFVFSKKH